MRFFIAGFLMLFIAHLLLRKRLPNGDEWKKLTIYGLLNISIYLGIYVIAMQYVSAGIGALTIATNPVFISMISAIYFKEKINTTTILSLIICCIGILIAAYPMLETSYVEPKGLILLMISMLSYSVSAVYFARQKWDGLHILTINGWQTIFGGIFLLPALLLTYNGQLNHFNTTMVGSVLWLSVAVSIIAIQLWLYLLKDNAVKAAFWLFLCPIFGFIIAGITLQEKITMYTFVGVLMVLSGLYIVQRQKRKVKVAS